MLPGYVVGDIITSAHSRMTAIKQDPFTANIPPTAVVGSNTSQGVAQLVLGENSIFPFGKLMVNVE